MKTLIVIAIAAVALFANDAEARSIQNCLTTYIEDVQEAIEDGTFSTRFCDILNKYMSCLVDYYESLGITWTDEMVKTFETIMENNARAYGFTCDFNVRDIVEKRRRR